MLVSLCEFDKEIFLGNIDNPDVILKYVRDSIPKEFKHIDAIYHNTRFYLSTVVMSDNSIPIKQKQQLCDILTSNMYTVGFLTKYMTVQELMVKFPKEKLIKYLEGDKYGTIK